MGHESGSASTRSQIERTAVDENPTVVTDESGNRMQHRRLAGTVRPDETQPLARLDRVGERLQCRGVSVTNTEIDERE